jgi:hypothetical protein
LQVGGGPYEREEKRDTIYPMGSQKVVLEGYFVQRGFLKVETSCFCTTFVEHLVDKRFLCVSQKIRSKKKLKKQTEKSTT